jgi:hypothetical protein
MPLVTPSSSARVPESSPLASPSPEQTRPGRIPALTGWTKVYPFAMRATSPPTSLPANRHLRRQPLRATPRNSHVDHHLRRITPPAARRNPSLRQRNNLHLPSRPMATDQRRIPPNLGR